MLAKVLAAVVKFDSNQTQQVLQREEQKVTLVRFLFATFLCHLSCGNAIINTIGISIEANVKLMLDLTLDFMKERLDWTEFL